MNLGLVNGPCSHGNGSSNGGHHLGANTCMQQALLSRLEYPERALVVRAVDILLALELLGVRFSCFGKNVLPGKLS